MFKVLYIQNQNTRSDTYEQPEYSWNVPSSGGINVYEERAGDRHNSTLIAHYSVYTQPVVKPYV